MIGVETRTSSPVRIIRDKDTLHIVRRPLRQTQFLRHSLPLLRKEIIHER